jgi:iron complex transport system substrate-binding protein
MVTYGAAVRAWLLQISICVLASSLVAPAAAAGITVTDDRGRSIALAAPARRIVTLAPALTELAYGAGIGDRLVAVARFSDYPAAAMTLPQIGDAARVDAERILGLKPDLVVGWKTGNQAADIERLERLGFKVFVVEPETLVDVPRLLRLLGTLAASETAAAAAADAFERKLAAFRERYGRRQVVRVFYEIWHTPLMTVNGRHMITDVIRLCGGVNVFADVPVLTPVVSLESVMAAQPDVVLGGSSAISAVAFAATWRNYRGFENLRHLSALFVDPDRIQRQTPRILDGAQIVCDQLDAVRAARSLR